MKNKRNILVSLSLLAFLLAIPIAVAKSAVTFVLEEPLHVSGKTIGKGKCEISYVTHSPEADVTFSLRGKVIAEVQGKLVERDKKAERDSLVIDTDSNGNTVLKEIRFAGKKSVLVFE